MSAGQVAALLARLETQLRIPDVGDLTVRRLLEELENRGLSPSAAFAHAEAASRPWPAGALPPAEAQSLVLVAVEERFGDGAATDAGENLLARLREALEAMKRVEEERAGADGSE